jgi:predicted nucleic acid-binding protein
MLNDYFAEVIISDTSCLIGLTNAECLDVLHDVYGKVTVTPEVVGEYGETLPQWIEIKEVHNREQIKSIEEHLDLGESSSIALALETDNSVLILDDGHAREYVSKLGLKMTGTLGVLIAAYQKGFIDDLKGIIEKLKTKKFRLPKNVDKIVSSVYKERPPVA